jgi:hypothetical protein
MLRYPLCRRSPLPQPHANPATVFLNELDACGFEGVFHRFNSSSVNSAASFKAGNGRWRDLRNTGQLPDSKSDRDPSHLALNRRQFSTSH